MFISVDVHVHGGVVRALTITSTQDTPSYSYHEQEHT